MNELTTKNQDLINEALTLTGERRSNYMPYIPVIRINNSKKKEMVTINGKQQEVEIPADAEFLLTEKDTDGNYVETLFAKEKLEAVFLVIRYRIKEKFDRTDKTKKGYYSFEFNMFDPIIPVFDGNTKEEIFSGNYQAMKKHFETGKTKDGFPTKGFDLFMVSYIDVKGTVYRFEKKVIYQDPWYEYKNSFGQSDTYLAYETIIELEKQKFGSVEFWGVKFKRGQPVNLEAEMNLFREINKFFVAQINFSKRDELIQTINPIEQDENADLLIPTDFNSMPADFDSSGPIPF